MPDHPDEDRIDNGEPPKTDADGDSQTLPPLTNDGAIGDSAHNNSAQSDSAISNSPSGDSAIDATASEGWTDASEPFPAEGRTPIIGSDATVEAEVDSDTARNDVGGIADATTEPVSSDLVSVGPLRQGQASPTTGQLVTADGQVYAPSQTGGLLKEPLTVQALDRIRYLKSYYFIFDSQNWYLAVLASFLCVFVSQVIPILPYIVFGGYLLFVIESQLTAPEHPYPDFAFEKFADYLAKAIWSFLIGMGFLVILGVLYFVCYFGGIFGIIAAASNQDADTVGLTLSLGLPAIVLMWMGIIGGSIILSSAMMLRAGLAGSFVEGFRIRWLWDFFRRTWVEQILAAAFFTIAYNLLTLLGLLAFCLGAFVAQGVALMAHAHVVSQLYRLYLTRGGEPIPGHCFGDDPQADEEMTTVADDQAAQ